MARFTDIFSDETKEGYKIPKEKYLKQGTYPIIDQGQEYIAGYTNDSDGLYRNVPAIIFGDHTRIIKYIDMPFFLGADGVKLLKAKDSNANYKYLYYALTNAKIPNTGYNRHFKWLKEVELSLPSLSKQLHIVTILDKLTTLISLRKQQLAKLDELVKARFVEMFGEPGQDPNNWGLKSLGECCILNPSKNQNKRLNSNLMVSFVPMSSVLENGNIDVTDIREYQKVRNGFTYFAENDVLFAKITPCMENGKGAIAQGLYNGIGFGSTEFHVLRPIEKKSNSYWLYALTTSEKFRMEAASKMTGSAGQRRVPALFLENYKVCLPPIILQNQFETFVRSINALKLTIRLCVDKMEVLKNSLMQKFFGQQGEYI